MTKVPTFIYQIRKQLRKIARYRVGKRCKFQDRAEWASVNLRKIGSLQIHDVQMCLLANIKAGLENGTASYFTMQSKTAILFHTTLVCPK